MYVLCEDLPPAGLTQCMHTPSIPLQLRDVVLSDGIRDTNGRGVVITQFLVADAIKRLHGGAVAAVFSDSTLYPEFPVIDKLPSRKTKFWQFAGITANEGTIEGTYQVHDDIYKHQLQLHPSITPGSPDDFSDRLYLVHGDQLTTHHIRAVQQESVRASLAYDRRQWICGVPAWFHIQMNLLNTIVRTHFTPVIPTESTYHTILADSVLWGRSITKRDNAKYHLTEPIVTQGFTARVAAMFYASMERHGWLSPDVGGSGRQEDISAEISNLTPDQFLVVVEDIRLVAFTKAAWDAPAADVDFRTMCRMLQEVELFLTVRRAVKYGDIGMLRRLVDPLIVVFFGASQHNYGREMLHYRWQLSRANTPVLQRAILSSGLVNWQGLPNTFKPIDLALEHLNCNLKLDLRNLKNSTHDVGLAFKRGALCNTWLRGLRNKLELVYGENMSGKHTSAAAIPDMFLLAWQTYTGGLAHPRPAASPAASAAMFDSLDIYSIGMDALEERVIQFNQTYVSQSVLPSVIPDYDVDEDGFVDINSFALLVHEGYDGINDLVLDLPAPPVAVADEVESLDLS